MKKMKLIEILIVAIVLPIVFGMAWLAEKKDKWDDLEFYDDEEF